ncbi:hypothetical protein ADT26_20145 [Xanthomonas oryzae]|nr:hypothetical protein ADT26_20145 [Xanthomonas oryzae]
MIEGANQTWMVEAIESKLIWLDCLDEGPEGMNARKHAQKQLKELKGVVAENNSLRFVYFICSRDRVRISTVKNSIYSKWRDRMYLWLEIGGSRELEQIHFPCPIRGLDGAPLKVPFRVTDKFITFDVYDFGLGGKKKVSMDLHYILEMQGVDLGHVSRVQYVGTTFDPDLRVLPATSPGANGGHDGYIRSREARSSDGSDLFFYSHSLKSNIISAQNKHGLLFAGTNYAAGILGAADEGVLMEKALIAYFEPKQAGNLEAEKSRLVNMARKNNVTEIRLGLDFVAPGSYFTYGSEVAPASPSILATINFTDRGILIDRHLDSSLEELMSSKWSIHNDAAPETSSQG